MRIATSRASPLPIPALSLALVLGASASAQMTQIASVATGGAQGDSSSVDCALSGDGRFAAFYSHATNLVPGDTNGATDVFVRDRQTGTTQRVNVNSGGAQANDVSLSFGASISADGRYVTFESRATNLVGGDTNAVTDVFVHDRQTGTTERASVASDESQGNGASSVPSISGDDRYVAFESFASNLVPGDTNAQGDIVLRDRQSGATEIVSLATGGAQANGQSRYPSVSADGRYVAFFSGATNLVAGDTNGQADIFVRDRQTGTTERVSIATGGGQGNGISGGFPTISDDGRYVAFWSAATNLVAGDTNGLQDAFVHDRQSGTTQRVSVTSGGAQGDLNSFHASISGDGRRVAFFSFATNLVAGDTNGRSDVFVRDVLSGVTERASVDSSGVQGDHDSQFPSISADGRYVAFRSRATNLVPGDANGTDDDFVRDLVPSGFTSSCSPGVAGVIACPCSNAPSSTDRGCNNSAATGGAVLSASGIAYLSADSLVFTTSDERATALSILTQWTGGSASGAVYGMGVRRTSGSFKRLFTKSAVGGSITAPDFGTGDPTVSARSSALGDVIVAGQSRWYFVYYRDPIVLGGCPATSTFNATQTGAVSWSQ